MDSVSYPEITQLEQKLLATQLPADLLEKAKGMIVRFDRIAQIVLPPERWNRYATCIHYSEPS